jgi:hypothetical protein
LGASAGALSLERTTPIGRKVYGYTAPGSAHTVLSDEPFYTEEVNGQRFVDWVTRLIERKPVDDVHCPAMPRRLSRLPPERVRLDRGRRGIDGCT